MRRHNTPGTHKIHTFLAVSIGLFLLTVLAAGLIWNKFFPEGASDQDLPQGYYGDLPDFSLTERSGKPVKLEDLKGKVWVASFVFTRCQGPCPLITSKMAELQHRFQGHPRVRFVSISVDPAFDTPQVLSRYAEAHKADKNQWYFLTGNAGAVHKLITDGFHLTVAPNTDPKTSPREQILHSLHLVLVDKDARIRGYYEVTHEEALELLRKHIRKLL